MKSLFLAVAILVAPAAFAQTIQVNVVPASPVIITSNLVLSNGVNINAPWFESQYQVTTNTDITLTGFLVQVSHVNAPVTSYTINLPQAISIPANGTWTSNELYLGSLPITPDFIYQAQVQLVGWIGTANKPVNRLSAITTFQTQ